MGERIQKCLKYFTSSGTLQPHQQWCLQTLVGNAQITAPFRRELETYLHIPKSSVKSQEERAGRRALMLLQVLALPDLTAPGLDWKAERQKAWSQVDDLIQGHANPVNRMAAEIRYRANSDLVSWVGMFKVALNAAWQDVSKHYGASMAEARRIDITGRVGDCNPVTFMEISKNTYPGQNFLGVTTSSNIMPWPRRIQLMRGMWDYTTVVHELLHYCSHDNFWEVTRGAARDSLNPASTYYEGVTHYFTLELQKIKTPYQAYEAEVDTVKALLQMSRGGRMRRSGKTIEELVRAYFAGEGAEDFRVGD